MEAGHYIFAAEMATHDDGFDPNYFTELVKIEEENWWFRSRNRLIIWALHRYFPQRNNFLEVGCGTGFILSGIQEAFPDLSLSGGELFMEGLTCAASRICRASLFQMDSRRIPFEEEFDVIGAFDMLEHIDEDEEVLVQLFKATKRGGGVILTVPQHPFLWSDWDKYAFHKRRYTKKGIIQKVEKAGFCVIGCTSFVSLLLPLMLLERFARNEKEEGFDILKRFKMGSALNRAFLKIMSMEIFMIRAGLSLPVGGSLLVAAQKI
jgi:SAM-dependent methyltransferase